MILQGLKVPRSKPLLKMSRSSSLLAAHTGSQLKREESRQRGKTFLKDLYSFLYRQLYRDSSGTPTASATHTHVFFLIYLHCLNVSCVALLDLIHERKTGRLQKRKQLLDGLEAVFSNTPTDAAVGITRAALHLAASTHLMHTVQKRG